ncbi:hypothetical protein EFY79_04210 [Hanamia caeni]|jgi:hypothetical protein|uniref:Uncharacterized protein n=1 Tax=Hanamia caeni TaxID=2294116 RepID=A0A3M9NNX8_9BACT|nr:hypothetical protein [Hanamia caeni]RNI38873.1 hypothetical protein EFY79_04210 [Hanamia caeni]
MISAFITLFKKIAILIFLLTAVFFKTFSQKVKLIEFGWDYPDVTYLSARLDSMQNTPFDGICFSFQRKIMEAFDDSLKSDCYFEFNKLQTLKWGKYTNNFIILRGFSKTGGNWFNDKAWENISNNMVHLSRVMQMKNIKGILFDPEYYYENPLFNPWTFSADQYPGKSFQQVQNQVKQRGKQFITSLQKRSNSFTFISLWIASLIAHEKKYTPIYKTRHALLISFFEGILEGKNKNVIITDGDEYAYWNTKPSQFLEGKYLLRNTMLELLHSEKSKKEAKNIQIAQPVYYDGLMATNTPIGNDLKRNIKWKWLAENLKYAIASSDQYMWFYSERNNWWNNTMNDTLLATFQEGKDLATNRIARLETNSAFSFLRETSFNNVNSQSGYYIDTTEITNEPAFNYVWNQKSKKIILDFRKRLPLSTFIYIDNNLQNQIKPSGLNVEISVPDFSKGSLIIINKYQDEMESSAIYILK